MTNVDKSYVYGKIDSEQYDEISDLVDGSVAYNNYNFITKQNILRKAKKKYYND